MTEWWLGCSNKHCSWCVSILPTCINRKSPVNLQYSNRQGGYFSDCITTRKCQCRWTFCKIAIRRAGCLLKVANGHVSPTVEHQSKFHGPTPYPTKTLTETISHRVEPTRAGVKISKGLQDMLRLFAVCFYIAIRRCWNKPRVVIEAQQSANIY